MPSFLTPLRSVARRSASRVLFAQRRLAEVQLAGVRAAERQVIAGFELYRVGVEAGLRFTEVFTGALAGAIEPGPASPSTSPR